MKNFLYIIIAFAFISNCTNVLSFDSQTYTAQGLDDETTISLLTGDKQFNIYFNPQLEDENSQYFQHNLPFKNIEFYDVIVETKKDTYTQNEAIHFTITLKNTGDIPDMDSRLTYYIMDENSDIYKKSRSQIKEVPPINYPEDLCQLLGGQIDEFDNCITVLEKKVQLPSKSRLGEWRLFVEYETTVQPKIIVYDTFEVKTSNYLIWIIIGIIVIIIGIILWRNRNRRADFPIITPQ